MSAEDRRPSSLEDRHAPSDDAEDLKGPESIAGKLVILEPGMAIEATHHGDSAGFGNPTLAAITALPEAARDLRVIELWLHGRSAHTQRAYRADVEHLLGFVREELKENGNAVDATAPLLRRVTLAHLQNWRDTLELEDGLAPATVRRKLAAIRSLLKFVGQLGYVAYDVGRAAKLPALKDELAGRILSEEEVLKMITFEPKARNQALLRVLYAAGARISEVVSLHWRDCLERIDGGSETKYGQLTLFGKGGKSRVVLLPPRTWEALLGIRDAADADAPVFVSQKGNPLSARQAQDIVRAAAQRAGIPKPVSPHWLRHAHASHALDGGAPIHLVQATLGHSSVATTGRYLHARPAESSGTYLKGWV